MNLNFRLLYTGKLEVQVQVECRCPLTATASGSGVHWHWHADQFVRPGRLGPSLPVQLTTGRLASGSASLNGHMPVCFKLLLYALVCRVVVLLVVLLRVVVEY